MGVAVIPYCFGGQNIPVADDEWRALRILGMADAAEIYHYIWPFGDDGAVLAVTIQKECAANETCVFEAVVNNVPTGLYATANDADQRAYAEQRKDLDQFGVDIQISARYQTTNGNITDILGVVYVQRGLSET